MERSTNLFDVDAVAADCLVKSVTGDSKLLRPIGNVGRQLRIDDLGIVRSLCVLFVGGVRRVLFGSAVMF